MAQSMVPSSIMLARLLQLRQQPRVDGEAVGQVDLGVDDPLDDLVADRGHDLAGLRLAARHAAVRGPCCIASRVSVKTFSSWSW